VVNQKIIQEIHITKHSDPFGVANIIAKEARDWSRVSLLAVGQDSIMQAVKSVTIARTYLEDDSMDLSFRPHFSSSISNSKQEKNEKSKTRDKKPPSALKLRVLVQQV